MGPFVGGLLGPPVDELLNGDVGRAVGPLVGGLVGGLVGPFVGELLGPLDDGL